MAQFNGSLSPPNHKTFDGLCIMKQLELEAQEENVLSVKRILKLSVLLSLKTGEILSF